MPRKSDPNKFTGSTLQLQSDARVKLMALHEAIETTPPRQVNREQLSVWATTLAVVLRDAGAING